MEWFGVGFSLGSTSRHSPPLRAPEREQFWLYFCLAKSLAYRTLVTTADGNQKRTWRRASKPFLWSFQKQLQSLDLKGWRGVSNWCVNESRYFCPLCVCDQGHLRSPPQNSSSQSSSSPAGWWPSTHSEGSWGIKGEHFFHSDHPKVQKCRVPRVATRWRSPSLCTAAPAWGFSASVRSPPACMDAVLV